MGYDSMRVELLGMLQEQFPVADVAGILQIVDAVAYKYEINKKETALTVIGSVPEIVKLYIAAKAVENLTKGTLTYYKNGLLSFFSSVRKNYTDITANDIRVYLYYYKQERGVSDSTLERMRVVINSFFTWLVEEEYLQKNPCRKVATIHSVPEKRHSMSMIELEKLRELCADKREKAVVDFLYSTGCRVQELCNVKISDIDLAEKTVQITKGKGGKSRVTYLNPEAIVSLSAYIQSRNDNCEYAFSRIRGGVGQLHKKAIEEMIDRIVAREPGSFKTHITPHVFRHTAATVALRNGMPIDQVQRFLGHSKISTTLIYAETDDSMVKSLHQKCVS